MRRQIAVKRLTASDLTLFEWQFRNRPAGNQKAINLNSDVFIEQLFPALPAASKETGRLPIDLSLYGPGQREPLNLQRKIIKLPGSYKNWRLDGEFISNPLSEPDRFNGLVPGDVVILAFFGDVVPSAARAVFLARAAPEDAKLHAAFDGFLGERSMAALENPELLRVIVSAAPGDSHPINELLEATVEEAALGNEPATRLLLRRRAAHPISREDLRRARSSAEDVGRQGEEFVFAFLESELEAGRLASVEWSADANAISPYDFKVNADRADEGHIEVKATSYEFERPMHFSLAELEIMASLPGYEICRLFEVTETSAKMRKADDVAAFARQVLKAISSLPSGVTLDSLSISPRLLIFGEAQTLWLKTPES